MPGDFSAVAEEGLSLHHAAMLDSPTAGTGCGSEFDASATPFDLKGTDSNLAAMTSTGAELLETRKS